MRKSSVRLFFRLRHSRRVLRTCTAAVGGFANGLCCKFTPTAGTDTCSSFGLWFGLPLAAHISFARTHLRRPVSSFAFYRISPSRFRSAIARLDAFASKFTLRYTNDGTRLCRLCLYSTDLGAKYDASIWRRYPSANFAISSQAVSSQRLRANQYG